MKHFSSTTVFLLGCSQGRGLSHWKCAEPHWDAVGSEAALELPGPSVLPQLTQGQARVTGASSWLKDIQEDNRWEKQQLIPRLKLEAVCAYKLACDLKLSCFLPACQHHSSVSLAFVFPLSLFHFRMGSLFFVLLLAQPCADKCWTMWLV